MKEHRTSPYKRTVSLTARQIIHEARMWLEQEGLRNDIPDPYTVEDIAKLMEIYYWMGFRQFASDLKTVTIQRYRHEHWVANGR